MKQNNGFLRRLKQSSSCAVLGSAVTVGSVLATGSAAAQDTSGVDETADVTFLEAITVTARKIEEPVQRIPFGITVFNAETIERERIRDVRSFGRITPGLNFVDTGVRGSNIPNIRGVGSFFPQSSDDTSVAVFVDGVPIPLRAQDREFFDINRIEVLRGPQNTLYGRNAQAGAINITTADPTFESYFEFGGEMANFQGRRVMALASGPLSETVAGRIAAQFDTREGDIRDFNTGDEVRDQDLVNANGKLLWKPSDATEVKLAVRYAHYDEQPTQGAHFESPDFPQLFLDTAQRSDLETLGGGLTVTHDFGAATLVSLTGFQQYKTDFLADDTDGFVFQALTGFPPVFFNDPTSDFRTIKDDYEQISQEIRLEGETANGTRWLTGVNVFHSALDVDFTFNSTGFILGDFNNHFESTSYAVFGEVTLPVTDRLRVITGLRYTHEIRDFEGLFTDQSGGLLGADSEQDGTRSFDLVTGRGALTFDFLPKLTGFASMARGAKAGGFQLVDTDVANGFVASQFDPAYTWSYETGVRGTIFKGAVDLSASTFFTDTTDEHVQVFEPRTFQSVIENIDTQTYGFELEGAVRPTAHLTFSGGLALLETEITKSDDPTVLVGNEVPFAPAVAFNLAAQYEHPLVLFRRDGRAFGRAEYEYVGLRTVDPQNTFDLPSYDVVNLRAGWDSETFSVYGYITNLLDETYAETAFRFGTSPTGELVSVAIPGDPRRIGVGAKVRF